MGWARVAPSRCLLLFILLTTAVTLCACLASSVMVWLAPQVPYSQTYSGGAYTHYPALSLAASALLSILSVLLGCCGLSRDSKAALILYAIAVLVVAGGELAGSGAVFSFAYSGELETEVGRHLRRDVMAFLSNGSTITNRVNSLQMEHSCCGVKGYEDWNNTLWWKKDAGPGQLAPESCCKVQNVTMDTCTSTVSMLFHTGCVDVLLYRMDIAIDCVLGVCVVAALLNLATALLACRGVFLIRRYQNYSVI